MDSSTPSPEQHYHDCPWWNDDRCTCGERDPERYVALLKGEIERIRADLLNDLRKELR